MSLVQLFLEFVGNSMMVLCFYGQDACSTCADVYFGY